MFDAHPNLLAYSVLLMWPVVALYLYWRLPVGRATVWTILGGWLLLPVGAEIKFPMVPAIDKVSIPNVAALVGCTAFAGGMPQFFRGFRLVEILILMLIVGCFVTSI